MEDDKPCDIEQRKPYKEGRLFCYTHKNTFWPQHVFTMCDVALERELEKKGLRKKGNGN